MCCFVEYGTDSYCINCQSTLDSYDIKIHFDTVVSCLGLESVLFKTFVCIYYFSHYMLQALLFLLYYKSDKLAGDTYAAQMMTNN